MKKYVTSFMVLIFISLFCLTNKALALEPGQCGGDVVCACGDTVMSDYTLTTDLDCSIIGGNGLVVGAKIPIILLSRSASEISRVLTCALAKLMVYNKK